MTGRNYGYRRMQRIINGSQYTATQLNGLAEILRDNLRGDVAQGMLACVEQMAQYRAKTEVLHNRIFGSDEHVSLQLL
jgi:hypothetical protein